MEMRPTKVRARGFKRVVYHYYPPFLDEIDFACLQNYYKILVPSSFVSFSTQTSLDDLGDWTVCDLLTHSVSWKPVCHIHRSSYKFKYSGSRKKRKIRRRNSLHNNPRTRYDFFLSS